MVEMTLAPFTRRRATGKLLLDRKINIVKGGGFFPGIFLGNHSGATHDQRRPTTIATTTTTVNISSDAQLTLGFGTSLSTVEKIGIRK